MPTVFHNCQCTVGGFIPYQLTSSVSQSRTKAHCPPRSYNSICCGLGVCDADVAWLRFQVGTMTKETQQAMDIAHEKAAAAERQAAELQKVTLHCVSQLGFFQTPCSRT
jgi:hypothetical protein